MSIVTFADVVHQSISFSSSIPSNAVVLDLIDTPWFQRLRDISQTANTRLVYMFSEHSRFGHSLGVAYMANQLMQKLTRTASEEVQKWEVAVNAAAILHDIGHLAPGSHTAYKAWFPNHDDEHEKVGLRIIDEDQGINRVLKSYSPSLKEEVLAILSESPDVPAWTWQIISGGGWNADRGNWCIVDSILAGVSYGTYNIPALTDAIIITNDGQLALLENRLDAMMHFAISRHAMYQQIYQHRVIISVDMLTKAIVQRARDCFDSLNFADSHMIKALKAKIVSEIPLNTIFEMRESWWRYHLSNWRNGSDTILADLSDRLLHRRLFKTVRIQDRDCLDDLMANATDCLLQQGYDPRYYLHKVESDDVHASDSKRSMQVILDNGERKSLLEAEPLFKAMVLESKKNHKQWLAMPGEIKSLLGRNR